MMGVKYKLVPEQPSDLEIVRRAISAIEPGANFTMQPSGYWFIDDEDGSVAQGSDRESLLAWANQIVGAE